MKIIPYGRQYIDKEDIKLVSKALKEDLITTGSFVKRFENNISKFLNVKYALSCSSGTSAIHLALMAINLEKDDVIIMPVINFIAFYNMAKFMRAKIFLADVDPLTGQMTPNTLLNCIKNNRLKKVKAIVTMYLGGYPQNVLEFYKIKKELNCFLIEDACHALGSKYFYKKKFIPVGSCKHADFSTFSLHPVKTISTGEGGIITTNSKFFYNKILSLRSHGIYKNKNFHWKYNIYQSSFNYRLSDINCALGIGQLSKIKKFILYRKKIYDFYKKELNKIHNYINFPKYNILMPSYHLFLISIDFKKFSTSKDKFLKFLKNNKIYAQYHYIPLYKFNLFKKKINSKIFKGAETYYKSVISLPIFYNLNTNLQIKIIDKIKFFLKNN
jgi:dTDP-4-amino-4,6-dideoxygalactose transaminase